MYDLKSLHDKCPKDYVINLDILGDGYKDPIYVSFIPYELDDAIIHNNTKLIKKLIKKYEKKLSKDVYNKLYVKYMEDEK